MKLFVNWRSADLDLVLAWWLFSKFQVQLCLDGTTLLLLQGVSALAVDQNCL